MLETNETVLIRSQQSAPSKTLREFVAIIFRHWVLMSFAFLAVFLGVIFVTYLMPKQYEARIKILIKRERVDPLVTAASNAQSIIARDATQEDLNSEAELLKSRDLLEKVVIACKLHEIPRTSLSDRLASLFSGNERDASGRVMRIPMAVRDLEKKLDVMAIEKSKIIEVRYTATDPRLSAQVLEALSSLYLEKHLAVNRPPGTLDFFEQQTSQYFKGLSSAEDDLAKFARQEGVISVELEKDITLHKLSDFESQLHETQAQQSSLVDRIKSLESQASVAPARVTTQVKTADNPYLLQQMKSAVLSLELKKTELLSKYEPSHRSVQEIETQLSQARDALTQSEKKLTRDETTDINKTREWLDGELARVRAEYATLLARARELSKSVEEYKERARQIQRKEIAHQDLARTAKTAEENYLLYLRKQEEARISDTLDRKRILNATIAEASTVPAFYSKPNWIMNLALGLVLALLISLGLGLLADYLDSSFRTPDEVEKFLGIPVLAATPRS
jgi:uncharacterized protein involved in exopolysaccharide biosynthesis